MLYIQDRNIKRSHVKGSTNSHKDDNKGEDVLCMFTYTYFSMYMFVRITLTQCKGMTDNKITQNITQRNQIQQKSFRRKI